LPVVLSSPEVAAILGQMEGEFALLAKFLYGTGLRISEALQLRVKDLDFAHQALIVRSGKGGKDRVVMLPDSLIAELRTQLVMARKFWVADLDGNQSGVQMPDALERKFPRAGRSWQWFWVFPQDHLSTDPQSGVIRRHHVFDQTFQRAFKRALVKRALTSLRRLILCASRSPLTCSRRDATFARFRSCSGTLTSLRP
jgi:integrase